MLLRDFRQSQWSQVSATNGAMAELRLDFPEKGYLAAFFEVFYHTGELSFSQTSLIVLLDPNGIVRP